MRHLVLPLLLVGACAQRSPAPPPSAPAEAPAVALALVGPAATPAGHAMTVPGSQVHLQAQGGPITVELVQVEDASFALTAATQPPWTVAPDAPLVLGVPAEAPVGDAVLVVHTPDEQHRLPLYVAAPVPLAEGDDDAGDAEAEDAEAP